MKRIVNLPLIGVAALSLAACEGGGRDRAGAGARGLCKPFPTANANVNPAGVPQAPAGDPSAALDDCLHRWTYSLAASTDAANFVAQAAVAACNQALANWNQQSLTVPGPNGAPGGGATTEAPSLLTGQATNTFAEHYGFAQNRALFYVVQARAGKCAPPPVQNGTPNGTTP